MMFKSSGFESPLSVAGRVVVRRDGSLKEELVNIDRDLVMIPSLAIHMNREAKKGVSYNPQKDLLPLLGCGDSKPERFTKVWYFTPARSQRSLNFAADTASVQYFWLALYLMTIPPFGSGRFTGSAFSM